MARIVIIGGTGYAGRHIAQEAASRGMRSWPCRARPGEPGRGRLLRPDGCARCRRHRRRGREPGRARRTAAVRPGFPRGVQAPGAGRDRLPALLQDSDPSLDWFFIHLAEVRRLGGGERTGHYRDGGDVLVRDADGKSFISGADFAMAVVDEIEQGDHRRERSPSGTDRPLKTGL